MTERGEGLKFISLWTPLHQAVYLGAPIEVVSKLLGLGASSELLRAFCLTIKYLLLPFRGWD
jgi:ankyrin repeat protein